MPHKETSSPCTARRAASVKSELMRNGVPENQQATYANEAVMDTIRQPAMQKMEQMLGVVPRNQSQLVEAVRAKQGALWDDQRKSLAQDIARMAQDMRGMARYGVASSERATSTDTAVMVRL